MALTPFGNQLARSATYVDKPDEVAAGEEVVEIGDEDLLAADVEEFFVTVRKKSMCWPVEMILLPHANEHSFIRISHIERYVSFYLSSIQKKKCKFVLCHL